MPGPSFSNTRKLSQARAHEYDIISQFRLGYRNREDITNLEPGVLIVGSQNVLTNVSERVQIRQGYSVDGSASSVAAPVLSSYDWLNTTNQEVHMRAGGLTNAGNDGKLQYRYVDSLGAVTWRDLTASLTTVAYNFAPFFDTTNNLREVLFVNGTSNVFMWTGAITTIASATSNTITINGTASWAQAGFDANTSGRGVVINGTTYTYTGGESTTTLTGVSPDPSAQPINSIAHQAVITTSNSSITGLPATFPQNLIATLNNQVYIAATTSSFVYLSKVSSYKDFSFSTPRQSGEGWAFPIDGNAVGMLPQENYMYITAGQDLWYNVSFQIQTSTVGVTYEQVQALPLKTGKRQAALSQAALSHMKNNIITITQETTIDTFGRVESSLATPQTTNLSDPIKLDIDQYDFTDASISYWRYYILVAIPKNGVVRIYNLATNSWEAPQTIPISRFYIVGGDLYGHSYNSFESYKLFTGYADRTYTFLDGVPSSFEGSPIAAVWRFSYQNYGSRFSYKKATKMYVEGYINSNTTLVTTLTYELDGCATVKSFSLDGEDSQFVCLITTTGQDGSLGKNSLGKEKLGGNNSQGTSGLPPKFRWFPTFSNTNFFESSISFSVLGVNNRAEILGFGLAVSGSSEIPVQNMD